MVKIVAEESYAKYLDRTQKDLGRQLVTTLNNISNEINKVSQERTYVGMNYKNGFINMDSAQIPHYFIAEEAHDLPSLVKKGLISLKNKISFLGSLIPDINPTGLILETDTIAPYPNINSMPDEKKWSLRADLHRQNIREIVEKYLAGLEERNSGLEVVIQTNP